MSRCAGRTKAERKITRIEDSYVATEVKKLAASERMQTLAAQQRQAMSKLKDINRKCGQKTRCAGRTKATRKVTRIEDSYVAAEVKKLAASDKLKLLAVQRRASLSKLKDINQACATATKQKKRRGSALAAKVAKQAKAESNKKQKVARSAARKRRTSLNAQRAADGAAALASIYHKIL